MRCKSSKMRKIIEIELMDKLLEKSKLTEADAERIGHRINTRLRKRIDN